MWQPTCGKPIALICLAMAFGTAGWKTLADEAEQKPPEFATERLQGRVVWLDEALQRRFGIVTDRDAQHAMVALETRDGRIVPIAKDARGRAFHLDSRLRDVEMELLVRRYRGAPVVQVIRMYRLRNKEKYEVDYWCDICAIAMYELKPCECCQGETRLRLRPVVDGETLPERFETPTERGGDDNEKQSDSSGETAGKS